VKILPTFHNIFNIETYYNYNPYPMNNFWNTAKSFLGRVFTRTKKVVVFPQEEEQDFIGV
jgi:hypothetical protein